MKVDILAIGVHPDDVELSCSGTLLRHIDQGKTVGLLDLTRGELGSRGSAELRDVEAANSALKMGSIFRKNLCMADGFIQYSQENLLKIIEIIRWCQPEIVLCNAPDDRHPDHGRSSKLEADACFYAGLLKIQTRLDGMPQQHWRPKAVYHYIQDKDLVPSFVVDITPFIERKLELILAFRSQFFLPEVTEFQNEPATPISGHDFFEFVKAKCRAFGRPIGVEFAEGFITARTPGVSNFFDLL
jgi:bacillithiol biosynthesis deacetylase BshB1